MAHPSRTLTLVLLVLLAIVYVLVGFTVRSAASVPACGDRKATIVGTVGDDVLVGRKAGDVIYGGAGTEVAPTATGHR